MDSQPAPSFASRTENKAPGAGPVAGFAARALLLLAAFTLSSAAAAQAEPFGENGGSLRRHGAVSRLLWIPDGASARVDGAYLSAGLALGTRGTIRSALGPVVPALVFETGHRTSLTLMAAGNRGAMLVWQRRE